jgi:LytS/YehU family sensor histidine kinase
LRLLSATKEKIALGGGFGALALVSMLVSFPIAPGVVGDYRNAVVAVAAIVGGPVPAIITVAAACAMRIPLGRHWITACGGIIIAGAMSVWFAATSIPRTTRNLGLFGLALACANALLPIVAGAGAGKFSEVVQIAESILLYASVTYPVGVILIGGLLQRELRWTLRSAR